MKKVYLRKFNSGLMMICLAVFTVLFVGCSDDDSGINLDNLYGKWEKTYEKGYEKANGRQNNWEDKVWTREKYELLMFGSNGVGKYQSNLYDSSNNLVFTEKATTYYSKGNTLYIEYGSGNSAESRKYSISVSSKKMVLIETVNATGYEYVCREEFEKYSDIY